MAQPTTFIKLDRNICAWRWYQDANTMRVFIDLLLNANISDKDFMGITVCRGQTATSYTAIGGRLNLTVKQVRTAIDHLKRTGEVAGKQYAKFQVITVLNYDKYQQATAGNGAPKGQAEGRQRAGKGQQLKNNKNIRNKEYTPYIPQGEKGRPQEVRFSQAVENAVNQWLAYKAERRQSYKPQGLQMLLSQIDKQIKAHGEQAVMELIEESMANNWQGIVWGKLKGPNTAGPGRPIRPEDIEL